MFLGVKMAIIALTLLGRGAYPFGYDMNPMNANLLWTISMIGTLQYRAKLYIALRYDILFSIRSMFFSRIWY